MTEEKKPDISKPEPIEIEAYKQAHETRRRWEGYIWQYGVIALALIGFLAGRLSTGRNTEQFVGLGLIEKSVLTLLTLFLGSTFLNVYRARILMKQLDSSISEMHAKWGIHQPIVPCELDKRCQKKRYTFSSTRVAVWSHLMLFIVAAILTVFVWTHDFQKPETPNKAMEPTGATVESKEPIKNEGAPAAHR